MDILKATFALLLAFCLPPCAFPFPPSVVRVAQHLGPVTSYGTGTVVSADGTRAVVLTCDHVVRGGGQVAVLAADGRRFAGRVLGQDREWDLAAVEVADLGVEPMAIAQQPAYQGDQVTAHGFGQGTYRPFSGLVRGYVQRADGQARTLEMTGRARKGDSGGPITNQAGELVGVLWGSSGPGTTGQTTMGTYSGQARRLLGRWCPGGLCRPRPRAPPPIAAAPPVALPPPDDAPVAAQPPRACAPPSTVQPLAADWQQALAAIQADLAELKARPAIPGPAGPPGVPGERGPAGPQGAAGDVEELAAEVARRLPPITVRTLWPKGVPLPNLKSGAAAEWIEIEMRTVHLGQGLDFYLIPQRRGQ